MRSTHVFVRSVPSLHPEYVDMCKQLVGKVLPAHRDSYHGWRLGSPATAVVVKVGVVALTYLKDEFTWTDKDGNPQ